MKIDRTGRRCAGRDVARGVSEIVIRGQTVVVIAGTGVVRQPPRIVVGATTAGLEDSSQFGQYYLIAPAEN